MMDCCRMFQLIDSRDGLTTLSDCSNGSKTNFTSSTRKEGKMRSRWKQCLRGCCSRFKISARIRLPTIYALQLSATPYISREYATVDARISAVNKHLRKVPEFLDKASTNLDATLADPIVEVAIKQIQGVIRDLDGDAAREAAKANVAIREEFERSKGEAVLSMVDFIEALHEEHQTSMDFALGRERFQKLLWVNDRISQPVEEVLELALRDLEANAKALREVTERIRPGATVSTILEEIQQDHPTAKLLLDDAAEGLHDLEGWLRERELVRIPAGTRVRVVPTPSHMRATTTAAMSSPGPFEKEGVEGL